MRVFVVYAHPVETSFHAGLHTLVVERLRRRGHDVDDCDLYAEGFDPVLSRAERLNYHKPGENTAGMETYVERLQRAEALVLCFPVWNYGFPAILKGFFDRLFVPGVTFDLDGGKLIFKLRHIRKLCTVTSYGGSRFRTVLMGDPPRRVVQRWLRLNIKLGAPAHYLAQYDMNNSTPASRAKFMQRVGAEMDAF